MEQINYLITLYGYEMMRENKITGYVRDILISIKKENDTEYMEFEQINFSKCISYKTLYETNGIRLNEVLRTLLSNGIISELKTNKEI